MVVNFITKENDGCDYHRLIVPLHHMRGEGTINMIPHSVHMTDEIYKCDILFFNRGIHPTADILVKKREQYGFKIVIDLDDYWELYKQHPLYYLWQGSGLGAKIIENIKIADLITVTNEQLAQEVRKLNPNVEILPNALPEHKVDRVKAEHVRFIYSGSTTHTYDVALLQTPLIRVGGEAFIRDNSHFYLAGYSPGVHWDSMARIFKATTCYSLLARKPLDEYMDMYNKADVSIIPLQKNKFNERKSILKILEAAAMEMPVIVSKVLPYTELKNAPGILWVEKQSDWITHMRYVIKNRDWIKEQGLALKEYINENYNFDDINKKRYSLLKDLATS